MFEVNLAAELVQKSADPDANIIVGAVIDENLKDEMLITVIATGFEKGPILKKIEKLPEKPGMKADGTACSKTPYIN